MFDLTFGMGHVMGALATFISAAFNVFVFVFQNFFKLVYHIFKTYFIISDKFFKFIDKYIDLVEKNGFEDIK
ncbi:hypothetical protein ['Camptotheca acuminata' phytoplasma]|uniref:hypothetical protein n=1 Tax='Camptotheca acuminata' phytoplasma TaxID=3239192 RepID=UPI003519F3EE